MCVCCCSWADLFASDKFEWRWVDTTKRRWKGKKRIKAIKRRTAASKREIEIVIKNNLWHIGNEFNNLLILFSVVVQKREIEKELTNKHSIAAFHLYVCFVMDLNVIYSCHDCFYYCDYISSNIDDCLRPSMT